MHLRALVSKAFNIVLFLVGVIVLSGCHASGPPGRGSGLVISEDISLKSYVHLAIGKNGSKESKFFFPVLQVYNSKGQLVYANHDAAANATTLGRLPGGAASLPLIPDTALLSAVTKELASDTAREDKLLQTGRSTVVSVFLEDCHACSVQEEALDNTQTRLRDEGMNLLIVHVAKPH